MVMVQGRKVTGLPGNNFQQAVFDQDEDIFYELANSKPTTHKKRGDVDFDEDDDDFQKKNEKTAAQMAQSDEIKRQQLEKILEE